MTSRKNRADKVTQPQQTRPGFILFSFAVFLVVAFFFFRKTMGAFSAIIFAVLAALVFTAYSAWRAKTIMRSSESMEKPPPEKEEKRP